MNELGFCLPRFFFILRFFFGHFTCSDIISHVSELIDGGQVPVYEQIFKIFNHQKFTLHFLFFFCLNLFFNLFTNIYNTLRKIKTKKFVI